MAPAFHQSLELKTLVVVLESSHSLCLHIQSVSKLVNWTAKAYPKSIYFSPFLPLPPSLALSVSLWFSLCFWSYLPVIPALQRNHCYLSKTLTKSYPSTAYNLLQLFLLHLNRNFSPQPTKSYMIQPLFLSAGSSPPSLNLSIIFHPHWSYLCSQTHQICSNLGIFAQSVPPAWNNLPPHPLIALLVIHY